MNKTDVVKRVANKTRLSQRVVLDVIDASHRLIEETLRAGGTVTFPGFGTFYSRTRPAGKVKDVRSGETIEVAERTVAGFRVGEVLKRAVAGKRRR